MKLQVAEIWMMISITSKASNTQIDIHPSPSDNIIQSIIICACTHFFASAPNQLTAAAVEGLSHGFLALSTVYLDCTVYIRGVRLSEYVVSRLLPIIA